MTKQTRKQRIQGTKTTNKKTKKDKVKEPEQKIEMKEVEVAMVTNTKETTKKKEIDWKKMAQKGKEKIVKFAMKVIEEVRVGTQQTKEKTKEKTKKWNEDRLERKKQLEEQKQEELAIQLYEAKNLHCRVGYPLHKQKLEYGKGLVEFTFGGYSNEHTITIVVESTLGVRSHSSVYTYQVEKGTEIHLPGLYDDGTGAFKEVVLKVMEINTKENTIHFEKNEK